MHCAAAGGHTDVIRLLIQAGQGGLLDAQDLEGRCAGLGFCAFCQAALHCSRL